MTALNHAEESARLFSVPRAESGASKECLERLDRMGALLQQTSTQIESSVVEVCDRFQNIADKARAETARLLKLLNRDSGVSQSQSFESLLQACSRTLLRMLDVQKSSRTMISGAVQHLRNIDVSAGKIDGALTQLEQISHGNRLLALNARIEAAHSPQHERGFNAVAIELAAQTERTTRLTEEVGDLSSALRGLAAAAAGHLERAQAEMTEHNRLMHAEVDGTLQNLSAAYKTLHSAVNQSQEESSELAGEISQAIRGMQFQDRVSQQLAHIVHDLEVVRRHMAGESGGDALQFSNFAMHEERAIHGDFGKESPEGDVELF